MSFFLDEISFKYWDDNKIQTGNKSYKCRHNGYIYGDDMPCKNVVFVYKSVNDECLINDVDEGTKNGYFKVVEKACSLSDITFNNFLKNSAEKYRIYSAEEVANFTDSKRKSTRIKGDNSKIIIKDKVYYVACNLKICEFFIGACKNIDPADLENWYIRIYPNEYYIHDDEYECIDTQTKSYCVRENGSEIVQIDFAELNKEKKYIGDLGELIVLNQERNRLRALGREDLAKKIEHSSVKIGDGLGYDIKSFNANGTPLYIEVKTTRYNTPFYFFMTKNEISVSRYMQEAKKDYIVRRLYNLNFTTGDCKSATFIPPFDETQFAMNPTTWLIIDQK